MAPPPSATRVTRTTGLEKSAFKSAIRAMNGFTRLTLARINPSANRAVFTPYRIMQKMHMAVMRKNEVYASAAEARKAPANIANMIPRGQ
jgi:hypothetical protein